MTASIGSFSLSALRSAATENKSSPIWMELVVPWLDRWMSSTPPKNKYSMNRGTEFTLTTRGLPVASHR